MLQQANDQRTQKIFQKAVAEEPDWSQWHDTTIYRLQYSFGRKRRVRYHLQTL